jgi:hypothetical protein
LTSEESFAERESAERALARQERRKSRAAQKPLGGSLPDTTAEEPMAFPPKRRNPQPYDEQRPRAKPIPATDRPSAIPGYIIAQCLNCDDLVWLGPGYEGWEHIDNDDVFCPNPN